MLVDIKYVKENLLLLFVYFKENIIIEVFVLLFIFLDNYCFFFVVVDYLI